MAILALLWPLVVVAPAAAHACAAPVEVPVGEPATVTVGITAESASVTSVTVEVPDGFRVSDAAGDGWDVEVTGSTVLFGGSSVPPFGCGYVTVRGVAAREGVLVFPLVVETADDEVLRFEETEPFHPRGAQLVLAGVDVSVLYADDAGLTWLEIAGAVLVGLGMLGWVVYALDRAGVLSVRLPGRRARR